MRRREFIALVGSSVAGWPLAARAQQPAMPVIGFLSSRMASESVSVVAAFHQGLKEIGYVEGQNISIEYRWADFQDDRLAALAADPQTTGNYSAPTEFMNLFFDFPGRPTRTCRVNGLALAFEV